MTNVQREMLFMEWNIPHDGCYKLNEKKCSTSIIQIPPTC